MCGRGGRSSAAPFVQGSREVACRDVALGRRESGRHGSEAPDGGRPPQPGRRSHSSTALGRGGSRLQPDATGGGVRGVRRRAAKPLTTRMGAPCRPPPPRSCSIRRTAASRAPRRASCCSPSSRSVRTAAMCTPTSRSATSRRTRPGSGPLAPRHRSSRSETDDCTWPALDECAAPAVRRSARSAPYPMSQGCSSRRFAQPRRDRPHGLRGPISFIVAVATGLISFLSPCAPRAGLSRPADGGRRRRRRSGHQPSR